MTRLNQGLFSTTMEAEKRDPGNEVANEVGCERICPYDRGGSSLIQMVSHLGYAMICLTASSRITLFGLFSHASNNINK